MAILALLVTFGVLSQSQVSVTTYKYDSARTGQNINEKILTPATVSGGTFQKIFTVPLDGYVYAQPLYVSGLKGIAGGAPDHAFNVVFAATEHDSLYAMDADSSSASGSILWHRTYLNAGEGPVDFQADLGGCADINKEIGISSTPVIDPGTSTMYLVTKSKGASGVVQRLHAISLLDGSEKFGGPVAITGQTPDGSVQFDPLRQVNRSALLLDNGRVVIAWASHCDQSPSHGWIMAYDASTLRQSAVFNTTPKGNEGGVWMSGDGIAADAQHRLFFATGNGDFDGTTNFSDSIIRLDTQPNGQFQIGDSFTPFNQSDLNQNDTDLGAGGLLLLPDLPAGNAHPHLLVQMGKNGTMYLIDRDNMGKFCNGCNQDNQAVQSIARAAKGMWGTPAYWNGFVYWSSGRPADSLKAWTFNAGGTGQISTAPSSKSAKIYGFSTAAPVVSADGTTNGIVWLLDNSAFNTDPDTAAGPQVLFAYDALDLSKLLYTSEQAPNGRDRPGGAIKFTTPIVANGKVFAGGVNSLTAWGLVSPQVTPNVKASVKPKFGGRDH